MAKSVNIFKIPLQREKYTKRKIQWNEFKVIEKRLFANFLNNLSIMTEFLNDIKGAKRVFTFL